MLVPGCAVVPEHRRWNSSVQDVIHCGFFLMSRMFLYFSNMSLSSVSAAIAYTVVMGIELWGSIPGCGLHSLLVGTLGSRAVSSVGTLGTSVGS